MPNYYMYTYASIPTTPPTGMWYAAWSTTDTGVKWWTSNPGITPDGVTSWVVGVVPGTSLPANATTLSTGGKDLPPQPSLSANSLPSFEAAFADWATSNRGGLELHPPAIPA